jgi:nucleotide-binding universal stress UspA family protein
MLVAVHPGAPVVLPHEMGWAAVHQRATDMVRELRHTVQPDAGAVIETDQSVARALERVATCEHEALLVLGSSRGAPLGRVRVDNRTRQLLGQAQCAVAVGPRGLSVQDPRELRVIGVAYDGKPEAREALKLAAFLARAAGAKLQSQAFSTTECRRRRGPCAKTPNWRRPRRVRTPRSPSRPALPQCRCSRCPRRLTWSSSDRAALELSNRCALGALPGRCCMTLAAQRLSDPPCAPRPKRPRTFDRGGPPTL